MHKPTTITHDFVDQLRPFAGKQLVFEQDGRRIQPGYHVSEIKAASFRSLDCGANPQQWSETIVQLWDVADEPERGHMPVNKFLGIWDKVNRDVGLDSEAEIKFEWGDVVTPAVHYTLTAIRDEGDVVVVALEPVRATCKPRDNWWMEGVERIAQAVAGSCCAPSQTAAMVSVADIGSQAPSASACCIPSSSGAACCN